MQADELGDEEVMICLDACDGGAEGQPACRRATAPWQEGGSTANEEAPWTLYVQYVPTFNMCTKESIASPFDEWASSRPCQIAACRSGLRYFSLGRFVASAVLPSIPLLEALRTMLDSELTRDAVCCHGSRFVLQPFAS